MATHSIDDYIAKCPPGACLPLHFCQLAQVQNVFKPARCQHARFAAYQLVGSWQPKYSWALWVGL